MKSSLLAQQITSLPPTAHSSLTTLLPILDAFIHRNKNQHRASHWWSHLNILRRSLRSLLQDPARARWLSEHVLPQSYIAFSQLAADNQYAPLGLLLVAVLARVNSILAELLPPVNTTPPDPLHSRFVTDTATGTGDSGGNDRGVAVSRTYIPSSTPAAPIKRIEASSKQSTNAPDQQKLENKNKKRSSPAPEESKRKKKKKTKAVDGFASLFDSL